MSAFFSTALPPQQLIPSALHEVAGALLPLLLLGGVRDGILFSQHFSTHSLLLFTPISLHFLLPAGRIAGEILLAVCMQGGPGAVEMQC
jgi:hypothetical protein